MKILDQVARWIVGVVFIFSGLVKINDPMGTAIKLEEYFEVFAADFAPFFAYLSPLSLALAFILNILEIALGLALLIRYRLKITLWILLLIIIFFTFLTFYSAYFDKVTDCGCFGDAIPLTPWQSFTKDVILLILIGYLFFRRETLARKKPFKMGHVIIGGTVILFLGVGVYALEHLPFIDFRYYKVGNHLPELMEATGQSEFIYIMEKDGKEYRLEEYPTDTSYTFVDMVEKNPGAIQPPKIPDFALFDAKQQEATAEALSGTRLLLVIHQVEETDTNSLDEISKLLFALPDEMKPMILTSSSGPAIDSLRHAHQLPAPYYFVDATVLKAMVRSNPGLLLLNEGTVKGKWHHNDVPELATLQSALKE